MTILKESAIIFGVNGSIGSAIAEHLISKGINVVGVGRAATNDTLSHYYSCDLRNEGDLINLYNVIIEDVATYQYIILAHGGQLRKPLLEVTKAEWEFIIETNLTSNFLICKYFLPEMIKNNFGRVVGITSLTTQIGIRNIGPYAASKGGLEQLLKTLAVELSEYDITVNALSPGRIATKMTKDLTDNSNSSNSIISRIPKKRFGYPAELTSAIDFLISHSSSYITGQTIVVDGGWLASGGNPIS